MPTSHIQRQTDHAFDELQHERQLLLQDRLQAGLLPRLK